MSFQALARESITHHRRSPSSLNLCSREAKSSEIKRGIYALPGSAPAYIPTSDAIVSALTKKPMKLGPLVQHVIASTNGTRSRSSIRTVLSRLKDQGTVKQDGRWGEYRLGRRVPPGSRNTGRKAAKGLGSARSFPSVVECTAPGVTHQPNTSACHPRWTTGTALLAPRAATRPVHFPFAINCNGVSGSIELATLSLEGRQESISVQCHLRLFRCPKSLF